MEMAVWPEFLRVCVARSPVPPVLAGAAEVKKVKMGMQSYADDGQEPHRPSLCNFIVWCRRV